MAKNVSLPPVRVEPEMKAALDALAEQAGISSYELIRRVVAEHVRRYSHSRQGANEKAAAFDLKDEDTA